MNKVIVNQVYQKVSANMNSEKDLIRLIWISQDNKLAQYVSLSIDVAMPHPIKVSAILTALEDGFMIATDDPFSHNIDNDKVPESYKAIRDKRWQYVSFIWEQNRTRALLKKERPKLFDEVAQIFSVHPMEVRRTMSRFWQRGMTPNTLLPDFDKRGLRGIQKGNNVQQKRGRPREKFGRDDELPGINITEDVQNKIRESIDRFYLSKKKPTIQDTYNQMLACYFSDVGYNNGAKTYTVWSNDRIPSYHQFYYWFKRFTNKKTNILKRDGEREFALKYRELLGDTSSEAFGPGFKYQIDATIADVYLVSVANPSLIVGRPVVYLVIDVFSRLIVGFYVGLEGPSWIGAMMALDNVVSDKVDFCKQYGAAISSEEWPSSLLPERILADRGEFEGKCPEGIVSNLGISIENTPPYRGDLKGIVERHFRITNEKVKSRLPGAVRKAVRTRGEADYRLDAKLNINEFTRIMLAEVLTHNNSPMEHYSKSMLEIKDNVEPIPTKIWSWGMENQRCGFIARNRDFVRLSLMPSEKASITREGIRFHGIYYSCDLAIREGWFINPKRSSIKVSYDPRRLDNIYISDNSGQITKCFPVANSKKFCNLAYDDYLMLKKYLEEEKVSFKTTKTQLQINLDQEIKKIVGQAQKRQSNNEISKQQRLRSIRENRANERSERRELESFELGLGDKPNKTTRQTISNEEKFDNPVLNKDKKRKSQSEYEDEILDLLKTERDERLGRRK